MTVKEYLSQNPYLLFDGAMGTYFAACTKGDSGGCENANLDKPELIGKIHREYLEAGAMAVKTNTFGANIVSAEGDSQRLKDVISAGWEIARREAADFGAFTFADIGPAAEGAKAGEVYITTTDVFLDLGAKNFLFETLSSDEGIEAALRHIRAIRPEAFIAVSFAVQPDGYTRNGHRGQSLFAKLRQLDLADSIGMNCVCGAHHMLKLTEEKTDSGLSSAMPNAGYPTVIGRRMFYNSDPLYFSAQMVEIYRRGVRLLGGCCGTTPEMIRRTAQSLEIAKAEAVETPAPEQAAGVKHYVNRFWDKLQSGKRVIAVELDPPKDADSDKYIKNVEALQAAGADAVTIADCPIARARMDSSILACKLKRELGVEPLPHLTCRDRNINATKALLMGLSMEGVCNVLTVTGDPVPTAERDEIKGVFSFNSRMLAGFIHDLAETGVTAPFRVFGALNVNAQNFDHQLKTAKQKLDCGMSGFLTQPVISVQAVENLKRARSELDCVILGGVMPVVSHRNAMFMNSEIAGIRLDPEIITAYEGKTKDECTRLAVDIAEDFAKRVRPYTDGWYMVTPFQRVDIISELINRLTTK